MLLDSEMLETLNSFAAGSEDLIFVVNESFRIDYLNSSALRFIGDGTKEVKGRSYADFLPSSSHEVLARNFRRVFESGEPASFENDMVLSDRKITLDLHLSPVRNGGRFIAGVLGVARDITERKYLENLISHSRREWLRALDEMPHSLAVVGPGHRIERVNRAMALMLNSTVRDAIGMTCYEQFHGTSGPPDFCPLVNRTGSGNYAAEVIEPHLGGSCLSSISSITDDNGKTVGCLFLAREISELERSLRSRKCGEEYMRMILSSAEYAVYIQDTDGKYVYFNAIPGDQAPWGLIGNSPFEFFEPATALKIIGRVKKVAARGKELTQEIDYVMGEEVLRFSERISPILDTMGRVKAVATVSVKGAKFRRIKDRTPPAKFVSKDLSAREREVLTLIAGGLTSTQVAESLSLSRKTVETHRARIMKKLGLHKTSALVSYAAKAGLLE